MTGAVRRIEGSDDETGTATLRASIAGAATIEFQYPSGVRRETVNLIAAPAGAWSGTDGISHKIAFHNLFAEPIWFFPALAITRRTVSPSTSASYLGAVTVNGRNEVHISLYQVAPIPNASDGVTFEHLTQVDLFLDAATMLPAQMSFTVHPDENALVDIPVDVQFADYRPFNGALVPYHIQKFINGTLVLDLQISAIVANSGLPTSLFAVDAR